ncbi:MAG: hypothetical protein NC898_02025 [Candidatus Omnitrophica bacterium]|nr:hypothetical protein [Candidatus Omnitrophota bacterium]MCM8793230.1 hypothetical protein [Candidatus Omnitrophota bacterium]
MEKCKICGSQNDLFKARDEEGKVVNICERCYETVCEGYERIEEGGDFYGRCC